MKVTKSQLKELIRHAIVQEIKIPFSSSHIKQLKRAFKDMKGTLPDNNPLVQQIVTLLKKTDKKVLKQIASADIKYLSDKAKDILGEGKLTEKIGKGISFDMLKLGNTVKYTMGMDYKVVKLSSSKATLQLIHTLKNVNKSMFAKKFDISKRDFDNAILDRQIRFITRGSAKVNEGTCGYGENGELGEEPAGPHLIKKKKIKEGKDTIFDVAKKVMKDKQHQNYKSKKGMVKLDMQTANLLTQVFKKVNPKMKKILSKMGEENPARLVQTLQAVVK